MTALLIRFWFVPVIAALVILLGIQSARISSLKAEHAEYIAESEKAARLAVEQALQEQSRRQQAVDEEAEHARAEIKDREATISQLADDGDRVREQLAAFQRRTCPQPKAASGGKSQPGQDPIALLSVLLSRADREAEELAGFADRLRIAGIACERASDQVAR